METITLVQKTQTVNLRQGVGSVLIQQPRTIAQIKEQSVVYVIPLDFVHFHFTATDGQAAFQLASTPMTNGVLMCAINGIMQSQAKGDFSVDGATLTLDGALDAGDEVSGVYAKVR